MSKDILRWGCIVILMLLSAHIYADMQGYLANAAFIVIRVFPTKSKILLTIILITTNFIGAILTAFVTALPCGYLAKNDFKITAILFIIATQSIPTYVIFQETNINTFILIVWLGQLITSVITAFTFAKLGSCIAEKRRGDAAI